MVCDSYLQLFNTNNLTWPLGRLQINVIPYLIKKFIKDFIDSPNLGF